METVRVGIIGAAWPGQRHIEGYQKHPNARVVAIADVNADLVEQVRATYGVEDARGFTDYRQLLAEGDVDAVSICTPNYLHASMAIDALEAGKHVLLEKPLAHTLAAGERLAAAVAAHPNRTFMIALNNRYRPDSIVLKEQIEAGELGRIYYAKAGWLRGPSEFILRGWFTQRDLSGGGPLIDLGVHILDLALWFMGNPRPVSVSGSLYHEFNEEMGRGTGVEVDVEDLAAAFVKLDNGATIVFDVSWLSYIEEGNLVYTQLFGANGGATVTRRFGVEARRQEEMSIITATGTGASRVALVRHPVFLSPQANQPEFMLYESFRAEVADFVDSIRAGRQPGSTIIHGLDILRVLDGIYRSAATGKEIDLHGSAVESPLVAD